MSTQLAATVLELVARSAPGAEAEVVVRREDLALTRFANSHIHQNVADASVAVRLRLFVDGRTAAGSTTRTDPEGLRGLVDRTLAAARLTPPDPGWPGSRHRPRARAPVPSTRPWSRPARSTGRTWCARSSTRPAG